MTKNDHEKKAEKHAEHHAHHEEAHHHGAEHHHASEHHAHHAGSEHQHHSAEHHLIHRDVKSHAELGIAPQGGDAEAAPTFELPKAEEKIIEVYTIFDGPLEARVTIKNSAAHLKTYSLETPQLEIGRAHV